MAHYSLCAWEAHQHYKDRNPPWVKLYRDTLTTESWVMGTDLSRLVQVASILLAARYNNEIPLTFALVSRVASLDCTEEQFSAALAHLARFQFIEIHGVIDPCKQDASNALATCAKQNQSLYLEESRGEERRGEGEAASAAPVGGKRRKPEAVPLELHASLPANSWAEWLEWRKGKKYPCDDITLRKHLKVLAAYDTDTQTAIIDRSIGAGWQGLFAPKGPTPAQPASKWL